MEEKDKELQAMMLSKVKAWQQSQEGQNSGYEYERSFSEMMHCLGQEILQASVGEEKHSRKKKP